MHRFLQGRQPRRLQRAATRAEDLEIDVSMPRIDGGDDRKLVIGGHVGGCIGGKRRQPDSRLVGCQRDAARSTATIASGKGGKMGLAISFFSVAVALASICLVTKKKPLWFAAMILAGIAVAEMVLAWTA